MGEQDFRQDEQVPEATLRQAMQTVSKDVDEHPELDELLRYHFGELDAADAEAVRGHLAACIQCTEALIDFEEFPIDPGAQGNQVDDQDAIDLWRSIESQLTAERAEGEEHHNLRTFPPPSTATATATTVPSARPLPARWTSLAWQAAAVVLLSCGISATVLQFWRPEAGFSEWDPVPLLTATAIDSRPTRGGADVMHIGPGAADQRMVLSFDLPSTAIYQRYVAELEGPDDTTPRKTLTLENPGEYPMFLIQRQTFPVGRTTLRLYGLDGERRVPVGTFVIERDPG